MIFLDKLKLLLLALSMESESITPYINIHTHFKPVKQGVLTVRNGWLLKAGAYAHLNYLLSVGLHPWFLTSMTVGECTEKLMDVVTQPHTFAIGEIGLDRTIPIPMETQLKYFEAQLMVARAVAKPVILHAVKSYSDFIPYQKKAKIPFIYHGFNGNIQQAKELVKNGALLSFGKALWQLKVQEAFKAIPLAHIFLETDNESNLSIEAVYSHAASLRGIENDELKFRIYHNFAALQK